jgi:hypothetical protein
MNVFTEVDAAWTQIRQHFLQCHNLLLGCVSSIIDEHIDWGRSFLKRLPELPVFLVTDENRDAITLVRFTAGINVYPGYTAFIPEIILPHLEAAASQNAYFNNMDVSIDKPTEVSIVNVKVVHPLEKDTSIFMRVKIFPKNGLLSAGAGEKR